MKVPLSLTVNTGGYSGYLPDRIKAGSSLTGV